MKKIFRGFLNRISEFKYRNVLFFVGIILLIYLVAGCMLGTIQESQARTSSAIVAPK